MTLNEANERARLIWGKGAVVSQAPQQYTPRTYWVDVPGTASVHFLDTNGRVACGHSTCKLAESRLETDPRRI